MGYYKGEKIRTWVMRKRKVKMVEKYTKVGGDNG